jgi:hypothetical protein
MHRKEQPLLIIVGLMVGQMQLSDGEARMLPVQKFGHVVVGQLIFLAFAHIT